ncbi:hypothetical protein P9299_29920 [Bacillus cereus]|uniref:hypothetical protein n=1 Tax=Bacillus thuringiensis TaxID=1428 RepID=UPI00211DA2B7|nr:hypothetical protein [Bacillus thuringiensis]MED4447219.1 hypothetical protein [Bacillus cereus]
MKYQKHNDSSVPVSIQLLFNNEKLDIMKVLCLMNAFLNKSKKKRKVSEILFYYSLVNFNLITLFEEEIDMNNVFAPSPNLYFRFQQNIKGILLNMSHLEFIEVTGDVSKKIDEITVKLLPKGKQFFQEHKSEFFSNLQEKYISALDKVSFSTENVKVIKGML